MNISISVLLSYSDRLSPKGFFRDKTTKEEKKDHENIEEIFQYDGCRLACGIDILLR